MGVTNFDTITLGGLANLSGPELSGIKAAVLRGGTIYYVDANIAASGNGLSWPTAFLTMAEAFAVLASGDTIIFRGKIKERLVTPVQVFDCTIIGAGNRPRHADSTPDGGQEAANTWTYPTSHVSTDPLLKIIQQGWRLENILFAGLHDGASVVLFRDGGADDAERDAGHAEILGCRFVGGLDAIHLVEVAHVKIEGCRFEDATGYDIKHVAGPGIANPLRAQILNNTFFGSANHVYIGGNQCLIRGNIFDDGGNPGTTVVCNTDGPGANGASNFVVDNFFQVATANFNTPDCVGTATDVWRNRSIDADEVGQPA